MKTAKIYMESFVTGEGRTRQTIEVTQQRAKRHMRSLVQLHKEEGYHIFDFVFATDMILAFKAAKCFTDNAGVILHEYEVTF